MTMQNVALQMGLRLSNRSGRRVHTLERFVMRCDGCATVCKSAAKVFCPACGHATLSRVSVSVGADGAEQYGVRKKHVLRGTRCVQPLCVSQECERNARRRLPRSIIAMRYKPLPAHIVPNLHPPQTHLQLLVIA